MKPCRYFLSFVFIVFSLSNTVFAERFVYESFIATDSDKIEFIGGFKGGQFGASIISGDFNGDGIDDLVVGSPFSSTSKKDWNGAVTIIFGRSVLSDVLILGEYAGDQFGSSLEVGDFNKDGYDDIAVGAYNAFSSGTRPGKVYIFYGKSQWSSQSIDLTFDRPSKELLGKLSGDAFGLSLSVLDFDNDGIDDLLVGAPFVSTVSKKQSGAVYVYKGTFKGLSASIDFIFHGQQAGERFGSCISGGDFSGNSNTDVAIGAYFSNGSGLNQSGKVYLYDGSEKFPSAIKDPSFVLEGLIGNGWFGFSMDVGDLNGDSKDDLGIGSFPYLGDRNSARVSIYYGADYFDSVVDMVIGDSIDENMVGGSILIQKLDSDNKAELIIGAPGVGNPVSSDEGDVYILYSKMIENKFKYSIKDEDITSVIHGENADDWFGYSLEVLDFNGDSYPDLAIGSRYSDTIHSVNDGKVFILLGRDTPFGDKKEVLEGDSVGRGQFITYVINRFDLKNKKADTIRKCYDYREFCLFNFLAMSSYDDIQLEPQIILYPDIKPDNKYYEDITAGTMLGLINGYLNEKDSPFHSELSISRVQALKVVLGAADLVPPKYRFEFIDVLGSLEQLQSQFSYFPDVDPRISHMWWYPRYVNFAVEKDIVGNGEFFRPDENITWDELVDVIDRTLEYVNSADEEVNS